MCGVSRWKDTLRDQLEPAIPSAELCARHSCFCSPRSSVPLWDASDLGDSDHEKVLVYAEPASASQRSSDRRCSRLTWLSPPFSPCHASGSRASPPDLSGFQPRLLPLSSLPQPRHSRPPGPASVPFTPRPLPAPGPQLPSLGQGPTGQLAGR